MATESDITVYEAVGGSEFFFDLVDRFYAGVADDPVLRPMYPEDLADSRRHLALFLAQYWGGPPSYNEERGHPMLRARHMPFPIDQRARDAWMHHMRVAVVSSELDSEIQAALLGYFERAATHMINQDPLRLVPPS